MSFFYLVARVADGKSVDLEDIKKIISSLDFGRIKTEYLPDQSTILGKPAERKNAIFEVAENFWNKKPFDWLQMEADWQTQARGVMGSDETGGKDQTDDVISAEILVRLLATCHIVWKQDQQPTIVTQEAINALNQTLGDAVSKGRTRMQKVPADNERGWITTYSYLRQSGVMVGTGGGKYLPNPEIALTHLFNLLEKDAINPAVYK